MENILLDTDSYKPSHYLQYPPNTKSMFSYLESRGGQYKETVFFGLQYLLKKYFSTPITMEMVDEAEAVLTAHGVPFNRKGWERIVTIHKGFLPVRIRAVPEGTVQSVSNVMMTVESTDPECFWVVSWIETVLMRLWYPITVATLSREVKKTIKEFLELTCDNPETELPFKLHDFGSRGVSSAESAAIGGAAHLVNFKGTDTLNAIMFAKKYYGCDMAGFSIPASEHSSITSWGRENEIEAYRNMIRQFGKPGAIFACVSDSYDIYHAVEHLWGEKLRDEVINSGATLVVRPDSGDPVLVVLDCLKQLEKSFGSYTNFKGFRVLNHVRVIQGDGIDYATVKRILTSIVAHGFSAENVAFGMGGGLLQKVNRDTQAFAFKCSSVTIDDGVFRFERDVYKSPIAQRSKKSKCGRLDYTTDGRTVKLELGEDTHPNTAMVEVYKNGKVLVDYTLDEIRVRAEV